MHYKLTIRIIVSNAIIIGSRIGKIEAFVLPSSSQISTTLAQKYGPIMTIYLDSKRVIVLSSSCMANQFLKTHDNIFANHHNLMRKYIDVPNWWFFIILVLTLTVTIIVCELFKDQLQLQ